LWLDNARSANAAAQTLANVASRRLVHPVEANELFLHVSADEAQQLRDKGVDFYDWGPGEIRLVTSWNNEAAEVERLAALLSGL